MNQLRKVFALAALFCVAAAPVKAQDTNDDGKDYKVYPHMFVGVQAGGQTTFTNYKNSKLITPVASLSFGSFFTPVVGARLHVSGWQNRGGYKDAVRDFTYKYNSVTTDVDMMLNLVTLFGKKNYYPLNVYLIGGVGLDYAWDNKRAFAHKEVMPLAWGSNKTKDGRLNHNARVGAMLDYNVHKNLSINLEVAANSLGDRYNSKVSQHDDWKVTAQVGLAVKFGYKKKNVQTEAEDFVDNSDMNVGTEAAVATVIVKDTIWYDDITYVDDIKYRSIEKRIFFNIRESDVSSTESQFDEVVDLVKIAKDCELTICSYADRGTGNPTLNMGYSKQRAEKTKNALIARGIDPSIIKSVEWKGDTVQPYPNDNDKNRVSIVVIKGQIPEKKQVVTKKFRIEEREVNAQ